MFGGDQDTRRKAAQNARRAWPLSELQTFYEQSAPRRFGKESQQVDAAQRQRLPHGVDQNRALPASELLQLTKERPL
jgi:hypothetical protein